MIFRSLKTAGGLWGDCIMGGVEHDNCCIILTPGLEGFRDF